MSQVGNVGAEGHVGLLAILWPYITTAGNLEALHIAHGKSTDNEVWIMAEFGLQASTSARVVRKPFASRYDERCDQRLLCRMALS